MKYLGVNIHVPENEKLEAEMRKIKKAAKMLGAKIDIESTFSEDSYTVVNHSLNRAVVIGSLVETKSWGSWQEKFFLYLTRKT